MEEEKTKADAEADEKTTQVQRLVRDAVLLYRARGYQGTISMTHTVGYFTESCRVVVCKRDPEAERSWWSRAPVPTTTPGDGTKAGRVFETLLARLEKRAQKWQAIEEALSGLEDINPDLSAAAQIGFAVPIIKLGWGVGVALTISKSSLLHYIDQRAAEEAAAQPVGA